MANVLKRFVRQLEEPLLTEMLRPGFLAAAGLEVEQDKLDSYRALLSKLPAINYATLRLLMRHLHTVADQVITVHHLISTSINTCSARRT